jgi:hypothetical protein
MERVDVNFEMIHAYLELNLIYRMCEIDLDEKKEAAQRSFSISRKVPHTGCMYIRTMYINLNGNAASQIFTSTTRL